MLRDYVIPSAIGKEIDMRRRFRSIRSRHSRSQHGEGRLETALWDLEAKI